ncbi:hypothetical protein LINGRAHAP2_LOCUS34902, partial [Linum grandiflorum]
MMLHAPPPSFSGQSSGRPSVHQCWPAQSSVDRRRVILSLIVVAALPLDIHSDLAAHLGSTSDPAASMAFLIVQRRSLPHLSLLSYLASSAADYDDVCDDLRYPVP